MNCVENLRSAQPLACRIDAVKDIAQHPLVGLLYHRRRYFNVTQQCGNSLNFSRKMCRVRIFLQPSECPTEIEEIRKGYRKITLRFLGQNETMLLQ